MLWILAVFLVLWGLWTASIVSLLALGHPPWVVVAPVGGARGTLGWAVTQARVLWQRRTDAQRGDREVIEFAEGLRSLVSAGLVLPDALQRMAGHRRWHPALAGSLSRMSAVRASGKNLADALGSVLGEASPGRLSPGLRLVFSCCL